MILNANRVVSRDRLVDELWADSGAADARHALDVQLSRVRRALRDQGDGETLLVTQAPGYALRLQPGQVDLDRFEQLVAEGRDALAIGDAGSAAAALRSADSLWRGRPLADLEFEPFARVDVERLQESRLAAIEDRVDADLALGRHASLVPELEALVAEHPLRERIAADLMLALYRAGRQADALKAYRDTRSMLVEELGIEPGEPLRELERAMLRQDPAIGAPAPPAMSPPATSGRDSVHPQPSRARRGLIAAFALCAAATFALVVLLVDHGARPVPALERDGLARVSSDGRAIAETVPLPSSATDVVPAYGSLWVSRADDDSVSRVDTKGGGIDDTIRVGNSPSALVAAGGALWVANTLDATLSRIDPKTDRVTQSIAVGRLPSALAASSDGLWVANRGDGTISRVDAATGHITETVRTGRAPTALALAGKSLWVANEDAGTVSRIDLGMTPATVTQTVDVGDAPSALAANRRGVWILDRLDSTVTRLDSARETVTATAAVAGAPSDLAIGRGAVWVAGASDGIVTRLDPDHLRVTRIVRVGPSAPSIAASRSGIWAAVAQGGASHRGGTLRVLATAELDSLDPIRPNVDARVGNPLLMTNDGLVTLNRVSGARGAQLVPDLALALPAPSDGGRSYTFRLRPGLRYSTGVPVRARDVRHSFERMYELRSDFTAFYNAIAGTSGCRRRPASCSLSRGIAVNNAAGTVTFHLSAPDPDFLYKLALPYADVLPQSTPGREAAGARAPAGHSAVRLAATGPYMVGTYKPGRELVLIRNPRFREWSAAAQPAGYPGRIVVTLGLSPSRAAKLMERRGADLMPNLGPPPADQQATLERRYASQLHVNNAGLATQFLFLNTRAAPFDDVRVRRAVNYALDRRRVVSLYGGSSTARPTCQILPPAVPGYRPYCPYTRDPRPDGRWRGSDLAKARRLVRESGTRGMRVFLWDTTTPGVFLDEGRDVVRVLRRLGYRVSLRLLPDSKFFDYTNNSRNRAQIFSGGWGLDYPAASNMLTKLTCAYFKPGTVASPNGSEFCDPAIDKTVARAARFETTRPDTANALWSEVDRRLVDRAIWLPTVTPRATDIVSPRVGNYRYHLMYGALVDQMWVK